MPNMQHCEIVVILDRSGSMENMAKDMRGGFNAFVAEQKKEPGECTLTLVQFDTQAIETVYTARPIAQVPLLVLEPRAGTPLNDAIGQTINSVGARFAALPEDGRPGKVLVLIITDGEENSSREFTRPQIKAMVERQIKDYQWQFVYLGANVDEFREAASYGIGAASTAGYTGQTVNAAFSGTSDSAKLFRSANYGASFSYTDDQKSQMKPGATKPTASTPAGGDATGPHVSNLPKPSIVP